jgi:hypothetical protein
MTLACLFARRLRFVAATLAATGALRIAGEIRTVGAVSAAAMTPPSPIAAAVAILIAFALFVAVAACDRLRLTTGDEGRQRVDVLSTRLLLRLLLLRLRLLRTLLVARRERLCIWREIRLRLVVPRHEARLVLAHEGLSLVTVIVIAIVAVLLCTRLRLLLLIVVGVLLTELFLRSGDQTEIMLGVLIVIFGGNRIAGTLRVTSKLNIFFRNVRGSAADLHIGAVRLIDPCHRVLTFAVPAAPAHALLTISHDKPFR